MPFPEIEPFVAGHLLLDDGAEIWWEMSGNPQDNRWCGCTEDPDRVSARVAIVVGWIPSAGRSSASTSVRVAAVVRSSTAPGFDLDTLTTQRMIADIEALREHLGIEKWLVAGASWGSTLALAYAEAHPDRVTGIVLLAVTSGSHRELEWISEGVGRIFPEAWAELEASSGRRPGQPLLEAYLERLTDPDPQVREAAALAWCTWEDAHVAIGELGAGVPRETA